MTTRLQEAFELLKSSSLKFVYERNQEERAYDFLFDAEFNNPTLDKLKNLSADPSQLHLRETTEVP